MSGDPDGRTHSPEGEFGNQVEMYLPWVTCFQNVEICLVDLIAHYKWVGPNIYYLGQTIFFLFFSNLNTSQGKHKVALQQKQNANIVAIVLQTFKIFNQYFFHPSYGRH